MSVRVEQKEVLRTWKDKNGHELQLMRWVVTKDYGEIKQYEYRLNEVTPEGCTVLTIDLGCFECAAKRLERWMD